MRMRKSSIVALSMATALTLTACSGNDNPDTDPSASGSGGDGGTASGAALTIAKPDGAITTESNNPWIGDSSALAWATSTPCTSPWRSSTSWTPPPRSSRGSRTPSSGPPTTRRSP
ncbi:hypothetical protein [Demequina litorisediminis]|uniref:hypothetical protein n=1 Tax=Demequina litorisediminis TaxID=1849022 RepID=UPI0024E08055|nr:hypothetical protein [Demequina litorisediminis]